MPAIDIAYSWGQHNSSCHTQAIYKHVFQPIYTKPRTVILHDKFTGMSAGIPKHVVVNLRQLAAFKESEEINLEFLKLKNILNVSGKDAKLPLKVDPNPVWSKASLACPVKLLARSCMWHVLPQDLLTGNPCNSSKLQWSPRAKHKTYMQ